MHLPTTDEVESLTSARNASSTEPTDAMRVVNALLYVTNRIENPVYKSLLVPCHSRTQIDKLKKYKNVLVMTTSNLTDVIDTAFLDRVDLRQHIGLPSQRAVYAILGSCIEELIKCEIVVPHGKNRKLVDWREIAFSSDEGSRKLFEIAGHCHSLVRHM